MKSRIAFAIVATGLVACASVASKSNGPEHAEVVVASVPPSAEARDPRDAICTSLQAASAAVRTAADEELRTAFADPKRHSAERAASEKKLAHGTSELERWTGVLARQKTLPKADPSSVQMATMGLDMAQTEVKDATAELAAPPPEPPPVKDLPPLYLPTYLNKCSKVEDGVWATVLQDLHYLDPTKDTPEIDLFGRWVVVHVGLDGKRTEIMPEAGVSYGAMFLPDGGKAPRDENLAQSVTEMTSPDPVVFDYDGDGHSEYVVSIGYTLLSMNSDERDVWGNVLTVKDGAIQVYKPAKDLSVTGARDVNGDGRPDLVSSSQHHEDAEEGCMNECSGEYVDDPDTLWLSRPDGTFVQTPWPKPTDAGLD